MRALARSEQAAAKIRERGGEPCAGDLSNVEAIRAGADGAEIAFHAAAMLGDWVTPEQFDRGNVTGTSNAISAYARAGVRRFVHVGTEAALLAGQPLVHVDETAPLRPHSPALYSSTKAQAEHIVLGANRDGFETVVVRPRFVWGRGDTTLLPTMTEMVRSGRWAWIGGGQHRTATTHVANTVHGVVLAAEKGKPGTAYFVTDDDDVVFRDFVPQLLATQGVTPSERNIPTPLAAALATAGEAAWRALPLPGRPPLTRFTYWLSAQECTINIDKARRDLGYEPAITREQGLAQLPSADPRPSLQRSPALIA